MRIFRSSLLCIVTCTLLYLLSSESTIAQTLTARPNVSMGPNTNGYYEYLPYGYSPQNSQKYPLLIAFGGLSQNGDGSLAQLDYVFSNWGGPGWQIKNGKFPSSFTVNGQLFRYLVILPQFSSTPSPANIDQLITYLLAHYQADPNRIYITGNSKGGGYCWDYPGASVQYSQRIAATIPTCAASSYTLTKAQNIAATNLPVWATHNDKDPIVSVYNTINFVNGINNLSSPPTPRALMSIFKEASHNCADSTFNSVYGVRTPKGLNIYEWLLTNSRSSGCNAPGTLSMASITSAGANISWGSVTGANSYDVYYKATSASTWISVASGTATTSASLSGLSASTSYDWRVRTNCSSGSSSFSSTQFSTLASSVCNAPAGLTTSSITSLGAKISWSSVTGANSYDVEYKAATASIWLSLVSGTTSTSASLSGLIAATSYNWRVRSNCSSGSSGFSSLTFSTASSSVTCIAPTGLLSYPSPTTGYVLWTAVSGAISYDVDYKPASSSTWINVAIAIPGTYSILSNLAYSTSYNWRVRTNCASGISTYSTGQFSTAAASGCIDPTGIRSFVTTNSASLSWNAASSSASYKVEYRRTNSGTWLTAVSSTTATATTLSGLSAATAYDWRVRSFCTAGSSGYSLAQFTTPTTSGCSEQLEPNNTYATASGVSTGLNINAQISSNTDEDYYRFYTTSTQSKIKVTLKNLPFNYDLQLYNATGSVTGTSQNSGTTNDSVILNTTTTGGYVVRVYSPSGAFSNSQCYTLNIQIGSTNFTAVHPAAGSSVTDVASAVLQGGLNVYPVPASSTVTVSFDAYKVGTADLIIINRLGQQVQRKTIGIEGGINTTKLDVSKLTPGMYFLKVIKGKDVEIKKLMIER